MRTLVLMYKRKMKMIESTDLNDYAMPTMMAERALKRLHEAFLEQRFDEARKMALEASWWSMKVWEVLKDEPKGVAYP